MAVVLTSFVTGNNQISPSEFRSSDPKRCKLVTTNLSEELQELYEVEQLEIVFPFGPKDMKFNNLATIMDQIQRPGKKPLLEKRNDPLRQVTFNAVIAATANSAGGKLNHATGTTPVDSALETIERIAQSGASCRFSYGTVQLGYFVSITKVDFDVKHRDSEGHPVRVDASFTLTEKPTFVQELSNLPVIPNDPPPDPKRGNTPLTPLQIYAQVLSNFDATSYESYQQVIAAAKAAGVEVDPTVHMRFAESINQGLGDTLLLWDGVTYPE